DFIFPRDMNTSVSWWIEGQPHFEEARLEKGGCDIFWMSSVKTSKRESSDQYHLRLYDKGHGAVAYYINKKEHDLWDHDNNALNKEAKELSVKANLSKNGLIEKSTLTKAERKVHDNILQLTSRRGHTRRSPWRSITFQELKEGVHREQENGDLPI